MKICGGNLNSWWKDKEIFLVGIILGKKREGKKEGGGEKEMRKKSGKKRGKKASRHFG